MTRIGALIPAFYSCASCTNGWVTHYIGKPGQMMAAVTRCHCWHAHQQRVLESLQDLSKAQVTRTQADR